MKKISGLRWWVVGLIALATVINYIDRQSLSVLWPDIVDDLFPDETADARKAIYAKISVVFVFSYAFGQAIFGKIFDKIGTRMGFVLSIGVWSVATALKKPQKNCRNSKTIPFRGHPQVYKHSRLMI